MSEDSLEQIGLDVSRETIDRLKIYERTLKKWNPSINLVSKRSLDEAWGRHILDSAQIFVFQRPEGHWVDLGSGGGLPALILAAISAETTPNARFTLIESDKRKSAFLRTAAREMGLRIEVLAERIEAATPQNADILSARALTDLGGLLSFAQRHANPGATLVFPKGSTWENEVEEARKEWNFELEAIKSSVEPGAAILKIRGVSRG
ncbi:16S rRNA (guanine(527)-N(7))-methyltransferase RsmG [Primorskyibacter sp. S87]|uniref:16S rRNA (guanine(527)-N(7))-methyltransferase RsmG n=1 Tax=Primorskyibacter sp. S87 TaxID=3415126 RepID=UPI003C7E6837